MAIPITRAGGSAGPCVLAGWRGLQGSKQVGTGRCAEDAGSWKGTRVGNLSRRNGLETSEVESRDAARDPLPTSRRQPRQARSLCPASLPCCWLHSSPALVSSATLLRHLGPPSASAALLPLPATHPLACLLPRWQRQHGCFPGLLIFITRRSAVPAPERVLGTSSILLPPFCYA